MSTVDDSIRDLARIFMPRATAESEKLRTGGSRFAYYTSAEVACSIIRNREVWLRNARTMNDFSEINYGSDLLRSEWHGENGKRFKRSLDQCHAGLADEIGRLLDGWLPRLAGDTYAICLSKHDPEMDNDRGRLSMWRAYGGRVGVALIFKGDALAAESNALASYASPVSYLAPKQFAIELAKVCANIESNALLLNATPRDRVLNTAFHSLRFAVLCTKHPGFVEEQEWRVIHNPTMERSAHVTRNIETVRGVPQPVYKIRLENIPEKELTGIDLDSFLDRVIVGPCEHPDMVYLAIVDTLRAVAIAEPERRVKISGIPLRHT